MFAVRKAIISETPYALTERTSFHSDYKPIQNKTRLCLEETHPKHPYLIEAIQGEARGSSNKVYFSCARKRTHAALGYLQFIIQNNIDGKGSKQHCRNMQRALSQKRISSKYFWLI